MAQDLTTPGGTGAVAEKKTEKKPTLTNNNREVGNLEQHILGRNLDKVSNYFLSNPNLFNYLTFRQVNGPGSQLINKLRGIDNVDVFYKIKTSVLSLMQPKIRLYKVNYEEVVYGETGTPDENKIVALRTPCYKEFKFSDHFGQETAASVQDYLAYESTRPTFRNVGLKSFSINQNGESHGVIENNIECNLELIFKSLKDIQASPPGEPPFSKGGLRYVDLITWAPSRIDKDTETYNPKHYEIKVIIGYTAPSLEQLSNLNLSQKDMENIANIEKMNMIVGLNLQDYNLNIKDDGQVSLNASYRGRIESVLGSAQVNIFQNTFQITKDGDVAMSSKIDTNHNISRIHRLITQIKSIHNELKSPRCKDEKCESRKKAREIVANDPFFKAILVEGGVGDLGVVGGEEEIYKVFRDGEVIKKLISAIRKKVGMYKKETYKSFVNQLIVGNDAATKQKPDSEPQGTRLFCINAGANEVMDAMGIVFDDVAGAGIASSEETNNIQEDENASSTTTAIPKGITGVTVNRCHRVAPIDAAVANAVAQEITDAIDTESNAQDKPTGDKKKDAARKTILKHGGKDHRFYFVYLGDIIELACKNAGMGIIDFDGLEQTVSPFRRESYFPEDRKNTALDYPLKNMRILLGPVEYYDQRGQIRRINLAQFPISFNFFRAWFMKKIVRRRRSQMSLGQFITSLINNLVLPAMGDAMPESIKTPRTRASFVTLSLPGKQTNNGESGERVCGRTVGSIDELLPKSRVIDIDSAEFEQNYSVHVRKPMSTESMIKTSFDYLLVYITTAKDITLRSGDPVEDVRDGIYHFNIGSDMGLLKNMSFKKVNVPFLPELRSQQAEDQGVDQLEQLKIPYDTDLSLIGTSLFTPGMIYYVNPSLAGLGSVESAGSLAYQMNLGGYHLIGQVQTTISAGSYETKIMGTQTSQGRR